MWVAEGNESCVVVPHPIFSVRDHWVKFISYVIPGGKKKLSN